MKKMSSENLNYLLIGVLGTLIIGILIMCILWKNSVFSFQNKKSTKEENSTELLKPSPSNLSTSSPSSIMDSVGESAEGTLNPSSTPIPTSTPIVPSISSNPVIPPESSVNQTELGLVQYFEQGASEIESYSSSENVSFQEKAKNTFTTIVDFIFYGKEVQGYTFKGLSNSAKLKVLSLALKIDHLIDQHFPNYKDRIKGQYISIKGRIALLYLEVTQSLCESVGADTCNQAKADFEAMKDSFGFTWALLKELGKAGKEKISDFYLNWKIS